MERIKGPWAKMKPYVLDCSVTIAWLFEDEVTEQTDKLLYGLHGETVYVPNLWHLEVSNVIIQAAKRKRITYFQVETNLRLLEKLPIQSDVETNFRAFNEIKKIAIDHNLTSYDAAYLELSVRRKLPLATLDKQLAKSAKSIGVELLLVT